MPLRDTLPPILRGEQHADLAAHDRDQLERLADEALEADQAVWLRDECSSRLKQPGASAAVEYLLAEACRAGFTTQRLYEMTKIDPDLATNPLIFPDAATQSKAHGFMSVTEQQRTSYQQKFQQVIGA